MLSRHRKAVGLLLVTAAVAATLLIVAVSLVDVGGGGGQVPTRRAGALAPRPVPTPPPATNPASVPPTASAPVPAPTTTTSPMRSTTPVATTPPATTGMVAVLRGATPVSGSPGGPTSSTLPATTYGSATTVPFLAAITGWAKVRLPGGGSQTGWVPTGSVTVEADPWVVTVSLSSRTVTISNAGRAVLTAPVAIGLPSTPTPTGETFLAGSVAASGVDGGVVGPYPARPTGLTSTVPAVSQLL